MTIQKSCTIVSEEQFKDNNETAKEIATDLTGFLKTQKIKMKLQFADSVFWIEGPYGFLRAKFSIDAKLKEIDYSVFSPKYDLQLTEKSLDDVKRLEGIVEGKRKWEYAKSLEDLWLLIDCLKIWAHSHKFVLREERNRWRN